MSIFLEFYKNIAFTFKNYRQIIAFSLLFEKSTLFLNFIYYVKIRKALKNLNYQDLNNKFRNKIITCSLSFCFFYKNLIFQIKILKQSLDYLLIFYICFTFLKTNLKFKFKIKISFLFDFSPKTLKTDTPS